MNGKIQLYPMMRIVGALILGILIGDRWGGSLPSVAWLGVMIALLVIVNVSRERPVSQSITLLLSTMMFGIWSLTEVRNAREVVLPEREIGYEAVVISEPQIRGKVLRCDLLTTSTQEPIKVKASILRDTLTNAWAKLKVGDGIIAKSKLEEPSNFYFDSNFDYARWLRVHGFQAQTFIYYDSWARSQISLARLSNFQRVKIAALKFRHKLTDRLRHLNLEEDNLALISAMVLGDKSMISSRIKEDYSISGGSHILALSGLHLGIIYAVLVLLITSVVKLFRKPTEIYQRWPDVVVQLVSLTAIWSYVVLVGMSASVLRSATMLTIYGLMSLLNRDKMSLNALATAAVIMLVINPYILWDVGFQMSFMAVLGILLIYPRRHLNWFVGMIVVSIAAQIGVAPLIMLYFGRFSCYFLLTNFIVIPCATCILYGAVLLFVATPVAAVQTFIAKGLALVAGWMNAGVGWIASLPGASIDGIRINWVQALLIYVMMFCAYRIICINLQRK
ncbi:ComEC/Rec2 family competence protein [Prevotella sp. KH2C16]|uniref:ComEC/Rec2 family competence protein n=1 Tax=Prevotella sp. KH2C16 TaxID=1855325 RepID=UPI001160B2CA|nr:ComEC/Rec2 family competence protein [Prevotella sp. KH2C16]